MNKLTETSIEMAMNNLDAFDLIEWQEDIYNKLAEYENTELEPQEVIALQERCAVLEQQLKNAIVPNCKVGDTVYVNSKTWGNVWNYKTVLHGEYLIGQIIAIIKTKKQTLIKIQVEHNVSWKKERKRYPISAIGITVFFTEAEAQAALDKVKGE